MITKYFCSKCEKEFDDFFSCEDHENTCECGNMVKIKRISFDHVDLESNSICIKCKIFNFIKAKNEGEYILNRYYGKTFEDRHLNLDNIYPYDEQPIINNDLMSDGVIESDASLCIFTKNLNKEHEKCCIEKLLNHYVCNIKQNIKNQNELLDNFEASKNNIITIKG